MAVSTVVVCDVAGLTGAVASLWFTDNLAAVPLERHRHLEPQTRSCLQSTLPHAGCAELCLLSYAC